MDSVQLYLFSCHYTRDARLRLSRNFPENYPLSQVFFLLCFFSFYRLRSETVRMMCKTAIKQNVRIRIYII